MYIYIIYIIILSLHLSVRVCVCVCVCVYVRVCVCVCVCEREREVTGYHSTATQTVLFLCIATAERYIREPTITASKDANSRLKKALLQSMVQKLDCEVGLHVAARRLPKSLTREWRLSMDASRREVILFKRLWWRAVILRVKLQNIQQVSWIAN